MSKKVQSTLPSAVLLFVAWVLLLAPMRPVRAAETAQEQPKDLESIALAIVAARTSLPEERLAVSNRTVANFPTISRLAYSFKLMDLQTGDLYGVDLNDAGQPVDVEQWLNEERTSLRSIHGGVDPELVDLLKDTARDTPIPVAIWLHEEAYTPPAPPSPSGRSSPQAVENYLARADSLREQAISRVTIPMAARLRAMGIGANANSLAPVLFAHLTPAQIDRVSALPEVDTIYLDTPAEPSLNIARAVIGADVVESQGIDGTGVRVAEIEVGGRAALNPALAGVINDLAYSCTTVHSTHVAGIIRSTDPFFRGIAPGVLLRVGGSCDGNIYELFARSTRAAEWGARVFNISWGSFNSYAPNFRDRFYDSLVYYNRRSVMVASGNRGTTGCSEGTNGAVKSPGKGYNVVTVGDFNDINSVSWLDDIMDPCSSWNGPDSINGDREKPEVVAPGVDIISTVNATAFGSRSGTSMAAPMVTGGAALLIQRNPIFATWPEIVKAILMASAIHNIEGDFRLSEFDGAGGISLERADQVAQGLLGNWGGIGYFCSQPTNLDLAKMSLLVGRPTRAVIAWDTDTAYSNYADRPTADLDLEILDPYGNVVAVSNSYDNTYEIVQFTPAVSGDYTARVLRYRCSNAGYLGFAWTRLW